jgi:hypothetical protein
MGQVWQRGPILAQANLVSGRTEDNHAQLCPFLDLVESRAISHGIHGPSIRF